MKTYNRKIIPLLIGALALLAAVPAEATEKTPASGAEPSPYGKIIPKVTLKQSGGTVGEALESIAKQARWGLVLRAPENVLSQRITVMLTRIPADRALSIVLEQGSLSSTFEDGVLTVKPADSAPAAAPEVLEEEYDDPDATPETAEKSEKDTGEEIIVKDFEDFKDLKHRWKGKWKEHKRGGHHGNGRVEVGGDVTVEAGETVEEAVAVGGSTTVAGTVERDAVSVGGSLLIKSGARVGKDAVAVGGDVTIEKGAVVEGEAVAVGGKVHVADGADVRGDRVSVDVPIPAVHGLAGALGLAGVFWILAAIFRSIFIFAIALLIVWIAPERVAVARDYLVNKTGGSILSGFLIFLGFVPLCIILAATIIGIPLVPILAFFMAGVVIFGLAAMLSWFGYWLPIFKNRKSPVLALFIGFLIFLVINMIPVVGGIFMFFCALAAAGATFLSRFGKKERQS